MRPTAKDRPGTLGMTGGCAGNGSAARGSEGEFPAPRSFETSLWSKGHRRASIALATAIAVGLAVIALALFAFDIAYDQVIAAQMARSM